MAQLSGFQRIKTAHEMKNTSSPARKGGFFNAALTQTRQNLRIKNRPKVLTVSLFVSNLLF